MAARATGPGAEVEGPRVVHVPMTSARAQLGALVRSLHVEGGIVVLERDGIPVAGLVGIAELEDLLEQHDPALQRHLRQSARDFGAGRYRPLEEVLAEAEPETR